MTSHNTLEKNSETAGQPAPELLSRRLGFAGERLYPPEAGCDGYITKPIDTRALPGELAGILALAPGGKSGKSS